VTNHRPDGAWETPAGLYVHEAGDGPLVVLVHGVMDRSNGMLRTRRILQSRYRIVRYDRRGYGRSRAAAPAADLARQVDDLAEVLDGRPAVVVGHSFGGILALALAQRRPELSRAVVAYEAPMMWAEWWTGTSRRFRQSAPVEAPAAAPEEPDEGPAEAAEWFMRRRLGDDLWFKLPRAMRDDRRAEGPAMLADLRSVQPPAPPPYVAEKVAVPVVAAHGEQARDRHRQATEYLATYAPDGELWVAPGADHGIHLSHPQAFADLVIRGVERAEGSPARR
jgi:pimeloyl-ACP methyl ester carboxylesterase